jgi:hypothetical protein
VGVLDAAEALAFAVIDGVSSVSRGGGALVEAASGECAADVRRGRRMQRAALLLRAGRRVRLASARSRRLGDSAPSGRDSML